ncbi:MAG: cytochrome c oxidase accessory protein CcoG [Azospirillaceae bacterium]|nr:cytochrome c oxidase accessory protein CcoG [Azospirillaceae bacterium]
MMTAPNTAGPSATGPSATGPNAAGFHSEGPLFQNRQRVYPKAVTGRFRRLKWLALSVLLAIYYITPWLRWDRGPGAADQAVLADMYGRRLYFFWLEIWPQEIYFLTGVLVLAAIGLFMVTALAGRVWCGFACPQTVWTDLFMLVERWIEGDRAARMQRDRHPWTRTWITRKLAKHALWLLIALATGGAWIFYFYDAPTLVHDLTHGAAPVKTVFFLGLFTATTYLLAGWAREQVCTYMCPWPRFQSAMLDEHSMIVTYEKWRGHQPMPLRKGQSWDQRQAAGGGDCIDCHQCIQVCPTGIDIRDGQQMECIGCGLCIDACNHIMATIGRPGDLITLDSEFNSMARATVQPTRSRLLRPRTVIYALILVIIASAMTVALALRSSAELTILRDRAPLFVTQADGLIRDSYTVKLINKTARDQVFRLSLDGLPGARLILVGPDESEQTALSLAATADQVTTWHIRVRAPATGQPETPITFEASAGPIRLETRDMFAGPGHR